MCTQQDYIGSAANRASGQACTRHCGRLGGLPADSTQSRATHMSLLCCMAIAVVCCNYATAAGQERFCGSRSMRARKPRFCQLRLIRDISPAAYLPSLLLLGAAYGNVCFLLTQRAAIFRPPAVHPQVTQRVKVHLTYSPANFSLAALVYVWLEMRAQRGFGQALRCVSSTRVQTTLQQLQLHITGNAGVFNKMDSQLHTLLWNLTGKISISRWLSGRVM